MRVLTSRAWRDPASALCHHPTESESELSVSGFLSVASHSCEEDEGRDTPLPYHLSALRGPTGMSGEGDHGNRPAHYNGVKKHRWGNAPDMMSCLFTVLNDGKEVSGNANAECKSD